MNERLPGLETETENSTRKVPEPKHRGVMGMQGTVVGTAVDYWARSMQEGRPPVLL